MVLAVFLPKNFNKYYILAKIVIRSGRRHFIKVGKLTYPIIDLIHPVNIQPKFYSETFNEKLTHSRLGMICAIMRDIIRSKPQ